MSTRTLTVPARRFSLTEIRNDQMFTSQSGVMQTQGLTGNRWRLNLNFVGHGDDGDDLRALTAFLKSTRNRVSVPWSKLGYTRKGNTGWTHRSAATTNNWLSICWSADLGMFCAVANSGTGDRIMTSTDGINWTSRTNPVDNEWISVVWAAGAGLFCAVAVSSSGSPIDSVMTSANGVTWTARTAAADNAWTSVCYAEELGLFVAVSSSGTGNRVMTSTDGINWTARTSASDLSWRSVAYSPHLNLFCAVSSSGSGQDVMTSGSADGSVWQLRTTPTSNGWQDVCWSEELKLFCAVANSGTGNRIMTSPDGINWTARTSAADSNWISVTWAAYAEGASFASPGLFVAVAASGNSGELVMISSDGINWSISDNGPDNALQSVAWSPSLFLFCAVANSGSIRITTSVDGSTGDVLLSGAHSAGATTLSLKGLSLSVTQFIKAGDFLAVGNEIKIVASDVDSGAGGTGTADIWPELHQAYSDNQLVRIVEPAGVFYNQTAPTISSDRSIPDDWLDLGYVLDLVEDVTA